MKGKIVEPAVAFTAAGLLAVSALAWWSLLHPPPETMEMTAPMMMPAPAIAWSGLLKYLAAWTVMMAAMMVPSALPMFGIYAGTSKSRAAIAAFALTYFVVWAATGIPAYLMGIFIGQIAIANAAVAASLPYSLAVTVALAGLYQFSPLKYRCLHVCRTPLAFLLGHWRSGRFAGLRLGFAHAMYCVGCCAGLMVVLVAAGAMSLPWVLAISVLIFVEKILPFGVRAAQISGVALIALGIRLAFQ
jgi:predicted metal-binding membrane protein